MGNSSSSNTRSSREDNYNNTNTNSIFNDTSISDVSIACIKSHLNSGIPAKEFMRLEREAPFLDDPITEAHRMCNKDKNRYVNILPCDSTRVRLAPIAGVDGSDYINANFIAGDDTDRAYIATQGPLMHTRGDFWRMVWENNTTIVVMLGKEKENERVKVDRYWPEEGEGGLQFQQLRVTLLDKRYDDDKHIAVRRLCISLLPPEEPDHNNINHNNLNHFHTQHNNTIHNQHNNHLQPICSRQVLHYQYEGWPDHGVPPSAAPIRKLVHIIEHERTQMQMPPHPSPIVVHCSAGVGRTGTFVTIHMTLLRLFHALRDSGNNPFQNLNHSTNSLHGSTQSLHGSTQSLHSSASSLHESTNSLHSSSGSLYGSTSSLNSLSGSSNSVHGQSNHSTVTNIALTAKFNLYDTVLKLRKQRPGMVQQQEQYVFCYEAVAEEAEHLGLIPADPPSSSSSSSRRAPRTLSISTSSLPSPSPSPESTTTLRTSSSSYVSSPTSVPPSPTFLDSSYFLNSSTSSLPSPPASPYIHPSALDCNTPSLFPPHVHTSPPHISSHSSSHSSPSHSSHDPSCLFPHESLTPPVDCQK